jgi:hypothetical protein
MADMAQQVSSIWKMRRIVLGQTWHITNTAPVTSDMQIEAHGGFFLMKSLSHL